MVSIDEVIASADKEVLVKIVRLVQKRGMKGAKGDWKEFLNSEDKKFGASLSDPAKRSLDILGAFLKTFTEEKDLKLLASEIRSHTNEKAREQLVKSSQQCESPQQKLVRLTFEHPRYLQRYSFPSYNEDWVITKIGEISKTLKSNAMIAVDCEMVLCEDGSEAVVKVCAVDQNLEVKLDELVNPMKAVSDYRTNITGITPKDLEGVTSNLVDMQKSMKKMLSPGTILIGHSLYNDLAALKIDHVRVIDTTFIFKYAGKPSNYTPSLNNLCTAVLGREVREKNAPHNCLDDARAAMELVLAKLEHGFDDPIAVASKEVTEDELVKLFVHNIPRQVFPKELLKIFPKDYSVELQNNSRVLGKNYSAFAVFKTPREVDEAFEKIDGEKDEDSSGRPQKRVTLQLESGLAVSFYIRKMVPHHLILSKKRLAHEQNTELGKLKIPKLEWNVLKEQTTHPNECPNECRHVKEIERLKRLLRKRDEKISLEEANVCDYAKEIESLKLELQKKDKKIKNLQKIVSGVVKLGI